MEEKNGSNRLHLVWYLNKITSSIYCIGDMREVPNSASVMCLEYKTKEIADT